MWLNSTVIALPFHNNQFIMVILNFVADCEPASVVKGSIRLVTIENV